jgi:hypothetical protein
MGRQNDRRVLKSQLAVGVLLLCAGFAVSVHSIGTTADYYFVGFALTMFGALLGGRGLATWLRRKAELDRAGSRPSFWSIWQEGSAKPFLD